MNQWIKTSTTTRRNSNYSSRAYFDSHQCIKSNLFHLPVTHLAIAWQEWYGFSPKLPWFMWKPLWMMHLVFTSSKFLVQSGKMCKQIVLLSNTMSCFACYLTPMVTCFYVLYHFMLPQCTTWHFWIHQSCSFLMYLYLYPILLTTWNSRQFTQAFQMLPFRY